MQATKPEEDMSSDTDSISSRGIFLAGDDSKRKGKDTMVMEEVVKCSLEGEGSDGRATKSRSTFGKGIVKGNCDDGDVADGRDDDPRSTPVAFGMGENDRDPNRPPLRDSQGWISVH